MRKCGKRLFTRLCKPFCFRLKDAVRRLPGRIFFDAPTWAHLTGASPVTSWSLGDLGPRGCFFVVFFAVSSRTLFSV